MSHGLWAQARNAWAHKGFRPLYFSGWPANHNHSRARLAWAMAYGRRLAAHGHIRGFSRVPRPCPPFISMHLLLYYILESNWGVYNVGTSYILRLLFGLSGTNYSLYYTCVKSELSIMFNKYDLKFGAVRQQVPPPPSVTGKRKTKLRIDLWIWLYL
jgi:hypothetical protein